MTDDTLDELALKIRESINQHIESMLKIGSTLKAARAEGVSEKDIHAICLNLFLTMPEAEDLMLLADKTDPLSNQERDRIMNIGLLTAERLVGVLNRGGMH